MPNSWKATPNSNELGLREIVHKQMQQLKSVALVPNVKTIYITIHNNCITNNLTAAVARCTRLR